MSDQPLSQHESQPEDAWRVLESSRVASSPRADVSATTYQLPDGSIRSDYLVVKERSGTLVVAITDAEHLLLVGQYRAPVDTFLWELPAGAIEDSDADPLERARAELLEETGYTASEWHDLGVIHAAPHRSTETDHGYLALGARRAAEQRLDPGESVRIRLVALPELDQLLDHGEIRSGPTLAVLLRGLRLFARLR
jgi:8-oxo-dGTP pyrophosphatase MutT (NUDIX family)